MLATLARMAVDGERICRVPGGFWTTPRLVASGKTPVWWAPTNSVMAMEAHGLIRRANVDERPWVDDRIMTAAGRRALEQSGQPLPKLRSPRSDGTKPHRALGSRVVPRTGV